MNVLHFLNPVVCKVFMNEADDVETAMFWEADDRWGLMAARGDPHEILQTLQA